VVATIGFDTSALLPNFKEHSTRGIGRYVSELSRFLFERSDPQIKIVAFNQEKLLGGKLDRLLSFSPAGQQTLRQQLLYPSRLGSFAKTGIDALHFPAHMDVPAWGLGRYMLTVLDLIPHVLKDMYKEPQASWRYNLARWLEVKAIKNAGHIIAISQNTARDVNNLLGVPLERISVTALGVDRRFFDVKSSPEEKHALRSSFQIPPQVPIILYVGGIDQRKNYPVLLKSFKELLQARAENKEELPVLVIAGRIQLDKQYPKFLSILKELCLEERVLMPGFVSDQDLMRFYSAASLLLFPSLYEGFGLTPLEAMAAGLPVVSSNASAMPEVLGDAALSFDPNRVSEATQAMLSILRNKELALSLKERGRVQASKFTWESTGKKTLEAYRRFLSLDGGAASKRHGPLAENS